MKLSIPDLEIELMGDIVRLEQGAGLCETAVVDVHRIQLAHIADLMGLTERPDLVARVVNLVEKVDSMADGIVDLRNEIARLAKLLDDIPSFPPGKETHDVTAAIALLDSADRLCDRFGLCEPAQATEHA